jgi:hypothetical protein
MGYDEWYELVTIKDPAAGSAVTRKIPGETFERLVTFRYKLVTSAVVGSRFPAMSILDGDGNIVIHVESNVAVGASATSFMNFFVGAGGAVYVSSGDNTAPIPDMVMPPGFQVQGTVTQQLAGDQISLAKLYVCRYPSAQWASSPGSSPYSPETEMDRG